MEILDVEQNNSVQSKMTNTAETPIHNDLERIFNKQVKAFASNPYPSWDTRVDRLDRVMSMLITHEKAITEAVIADYGRRPYQLTRFQEVASPIANFKHAKKHLKDWMKIEKRKSSFPYNLLGGKSYVRYAPLGVVANISPWNFPFTLSLAPLAGIIAAGNNCILKPSEFTPNASAVMADIVAEAFDESELAVIEGDGELSSAICKMPFDHIMFTGSTPIGSKVLEAAAGNLTSTTLELGGKSPVIISDSANIKKLADKLVAAKLVNGGQICMAPDFLLVPENKYDELVAALKKSTLALYPDQHDSGDFTNIVSKRHCDRLKALVEQAESAGNTVIPLFTAPNANTDDRYMQPSLIEITNPQCNIMREEIFGPILPIIKVRDFNHAVETLRDYRNPLIAYCFTNDTTEREIMVDKVASGSLVFNEFYLNYIQQDLPFGGVGHSGMGCYNAFDGFKNFSNAKAVFDSPSIDIGKVLRPPFTKTLEKMINSELKIK